MVDVKWRERKLTHLNRTAITAASTVVLALGITIVGLASGEARLPLCRHCCHLGQLSFLRTGEVHMAVFTDMRRIKKFKSHHTAENSGTRRSLRLDCLPSAFHVHLIVLQMAQQTRQTHTRARAISSITNNMPVSHLLARSTLCHFSLLLWQSLTWYSFKTEVTGDRQKQN
jgi:hypothetical protein